MTPFSDFDQAMMRRALALAEKGLFSATPNPRVGCVLAQGERIVGEGWHEKAGAPHAEANALAAAGAAARGATAYLNLEPCAHHGRTPPCADALVAAGVARVVAAMRDPSPAGRRRRRQARRGGRALRARPAGGRGARIEHRLRVARHARRGHGCG